MNLKDFLNWVNIFYYDKNSIESKVLLKFTVFFFPISSLLIGLRGLSLVYLENYDPSLVIYLIMSSVGFLFVLIIILRLIVGSIIRSLVIRRIENLTLEMKDIKEKDISKRFIFTGTDELDKLMYYSNSVFNKYSQLLDMEKKNSMLDPLTLTFNRRALNMNFEGLLEKSIRGKSNFSLVILDIDDFKKVNDVYGHDIGDIVLKKFVHVIKKDIRKYDTLYRVGGEEFLILFPKLVKKDAFNILNRIKNDFTYKIKKEVSQIVQSLTFSGGYVNSKKFNLNSDEVLDDMIKNADNNLYVAKRNGKNHVFTK